VSPGGNLRALTVLLTRVIVIVGLLTLAAATILTCIAMVLGMVILITG
jgi:hypothetical protein